MVNEQRLYFAISTYICTQFQSKHIFRVFFLFRLCKFRLTLFSRTVQFHQVEYLQCCLHKNSCSLKAYCLHKIVFIYIHKLHRLDRIEISLTGTLLYIPPFCLIMVEIVLRPHSFTKSTILIPR